MIKETEDYLNSRLHDRETPWPRRHESVGQGKQRGAERGNCPQAENSVPLRICHSQPGTTTVEVFGNRAGFLDGQTASYITMAVFALVDERPDDLVIDISQVTSLTAQFLDLLTSLPKRFRFEGRRLALLGVRPHCADLLRVSGLENRIPCLRTISEMSDRWRMQ